MRLLILESIFCITEARSSKCLVLLHQIQVFLDKIRKVSMVHGTKSFNHGLLTHKLSIDNNLTKLLVLGSIKMIFLQLRLKETLWICWWKQASTIEQIRM